MNLARYILLAFVPLVFWACAHKKPASPILPPQAEDVVVLYLYRPNNLSNIVISPTVLVDGSEHFEIDNNRYTYLRLKPGTHQVRLDLSERYQGEHEWTFSAEAGQIYYLRIDTELKFRKNNLYQRRFDLQSVAGHLAEMEMVQCRFFGVPGHAAKAAATGSPGEMNGASEDAKFSISRSRDPFGRNR